MVYKKFWYLLFLILLLPLSLLSCAKKYHGNIAINDVNNYNEIVINIGEHDKKYEFDIEISGDVSIPQLALWSTESKIINSLGFEIIGNKLNVFYSTNNKSFVYIDHEVTSTFTIYDQKTKIESNSIPIKLVPRNDDTIYYNQDSIDIFNKLNKITFGLEIDNKVATTTMFGKYFNVVGNDITYTSYKYFFTTMLDVFVLDQTTHQLVSTANIKFYISDSDFSIPTSNIVSLDASNITFFDYNPLDLKFNPEDYVPDDGHGEPGHVHEDIEWKLPLQFIAIDFSSYIASNTILKNKLDSVDFNDTNFNTTYDVFSQYSVEKNIFSEPGNTDVILKLNENDLYYTLGLNQAKNKLVKRSFNIYQGRNIYRYNTIFSNGVGGNIYNFVFQKNYYQGNFLISEYYSCFNSLNALGGIVVNKNFKVMGSVFNNNTLLDATATNPHSISIVLWSGVLDDTYKGSNLSNIGIYNDLANNKQSMNYKFTSYFDYPYSIIYDIKYVSLHDDMIDPYTEIEWSNGFYTYVINNL